MIRTALDIHLWVRAASLWAPRGGVGYETQQGSASASTAENWELLKTSLGALLGGLAQRRQSRTEEVVCFMYEQFHSKIHKCV